MKKPLLLFLSGLCVVPILAPDEPVGSSQQKNNTKTDKSEKQEINMTELLEQWAGKDREYRKTMAMLALEEKRLRTEYEKMKPGQQRDCLIHLLGPKK